MSLQLTWNTVSGSSTELFWRRDWIVRIRALLGELGCGRMDGAGGRLRWRKGAGGGLPGAENGSRSLPGSDADDEEGEEK